MAQKKFEELNLNNAFLFAAALEDEETCRMVLEVILGRKLPRVKVHVEHSILYSADLRSIRLDVYAMDEVQALKQNRRWRERYMTAEEYLRGIAKDMAREAAREAAEKAARETAEKTARETEENTRNRILHLISAMAQAGEAELLPRLGEGGEFLEQMYEKYHI